MGMGEILTGNRTYFIEPVAYDNQRAPIIPEQIRPVPLAAANAGMSGFYDETSVSDALKPAAALVGVPVIGWAALVAALFGFGMLQGWAESKTKRRRR